MTNEESIELLTYDEVLERVAEGRVSLLLGNGFSIACDPVFQYDSLYDRAVEAELSDRAQAVFERLGENNFEGVMHLLDDADWVAKTYGLIDPDEATILDDVQTLREALIQAINESHLAHTGRVQDAKKRAALEFIAPYYHVFTVNYDLLLYWVTMSADKRRFRDGFGDDPEDPKAPYVIFKNNIRDRRGIYYLHGALHLYRAIGEHRKACWNRNDVPLIDQIAANLAERHYPLFVAEGDSEKKLQQINGDAYLSACLYKLSRIGSPLVVLGHSLRESDAHILNTVALNKDIPTVYVGLFKDLDHPDSIKTMAAATRTSRKRAEHFSDYPVEIKYFDSRTAHVWGDEDTDE